MRQSCLLSHSDSRRDGLSSSKSSGGGAFSAALFVAYFRNEIIFFSLKIKFNKSTFFLFLKKINFIVNDDFLKKFFLKKKSK
jgi:hypothetical protein